EQTRLAERLLICNVPSGLQIRERLERVCALQRAREGDVDAVVKKVRAEFERVRATLESYVVNQFVKISVAPGRRTRGRPPIRHAGDVDRRADQVVGRRGEAAARELKTRLVGDAR